LVDLAEEVHGKIHVHPLNLASRPSRLRPVQIRRQVGTGVREDVERLSRDRLCRTFPLRRGARVGPR
jgi:hypothetical protein